MNALTKTMMKLLPPKKISSYKSSDLMIYPSTHCITKESFHTWNTMPGPLRNPFTGEPINSDNIAILKYNTDGFNLNLESVIY